MTSMIYPTTNPAMSETMVVARAEGPYIYDKQGKRYLEGMAGLWCTALGYGNEEIIETAERQMRELSFSHMFGGKTHSSPLVVIPESPAIAGAGLMGGAERTRDWLAPPTAGLPSSAALPQVALVFSLPQRAQRKRVISSPRCTAKGSLLTGRHL